MALADSYQQTATDTPSPSPSKVRMPRISKERFRKTTKESVESKRKTSFEATTNGTNKSGIHRTGSSLQLTFGGKKKAIYVLDGNASKARLNEHVRT